MSLEWKSLEWELPVYYINSSSLVLELSKTSILLQNNDITYIINVFCDGTSSPTISKIHHSEKCLDIVKTGDNVFYVAVNGQLSRLTCSAAISANDVFGFGSSSDSGSVYAWLQIDAKFQNLTAVSDVTEGIATISQVGQVHFYTVYSTNHKISKKFSLKLPNTLGSLKWVFKPYSSFLFCSKLLNYVFGEGSLLATDLLLTSTPSGRVMLLSSNISRAIEENNTIYYDSKSQLIEVYVCKMKSCILLLYASGKIVKIAFSTTIEIDVFYLNAGIQSVLVHQVDNRYFILWCDGIKIGFGVLEDDIKIINLEKRLCGIEGFLTLFKNSIYCYNSNLCFYEILIDEKGVSPTKNTKQILNKMTNIGEKIANIHKKIEEYDRILEAFSCEEISKDEIKIKLNRFNIHIENNSKLLFSKEFWSIKFEECTSEIHSCLLLPFEEDLMSGKTLIFPLSDVFHRSECINVSLIGNVPQFSDGRLLLVELGEVCLPKTNNRNSSELLQERLKKLQIC